MVHLKAAEGENIRFNYLNTSYVMVHQQQHGQQQKTDEFKYILCYGSSWNIGRFAAIIKI